MKASMLVKKIEAGIKKFGDLPVLIETTHVDKLKITKEGPFSEISSKRYKGKTFINIEAK